MISAIALCVTFPLMAVIAMLIKLTSPGQALYRAQRVGLKGRRFSCYKFRTMVSDADELKDGLRAKNERQGPCFKLAADPRITCVGRWLRRYSLDELPQLWNVLRGEMSMVGPRPHPLDDFSRYRLDHLRRLDVTPGITGLWQVTARRDPSFQRNMTLDLEYIEHWSLGMDLEDSVEDSLRGPMRDGLLKMAATGQITLRNSMPSLAHSAIVTVFWPLQALMAAPAMLFLATLAVMLFRPPDLQFYWADRIAFVLLVFVVVLRTLLLRRPLSIANPAMWPMAALILIGLASLLLEPYDAQSWSVFAAKWVVPFVLYHLAGAVSIILPLYVSSKCLP